MNKIKENIILKTLEIISMMLWTTLFLDIITTVLLEQVYKCIINNFNFTVILKATIPGWFFFQMLPINLILMVFFAFNIHIFERMLLTNLLSHLYILFYVPMTVFSSLGTMFFKMKVKVEGGGAGTSFRLKLVDSETGDQMRVF